MRLLPKAASYLWNHKKVSIILAIILGLIIFLVFPKNSSPIETAKVKKNKIVQTVTASGKVESETSVSLSFITGGKLTYLGVKKGEFVSAGQTIAVLDQRSIRTNIENALEDYALARNQFDQVKEDNQNRNPQEALNSEMKRILENNQNDLDKAIKSVELQRFILDQSVLSSPINGVVTRADVQVPGVNVTPTTVFTVADLDNLVFNIDVDEADIAKIFIGQKANVTFDAFPDRIIPLDITFIDFASHISEAGATVYTVKATIADPGSYRIGMNGDAEIVIAQKSNPLVIPLSALIDENHVYVKTAKLFEKRKIVTGLQSDTDIEIIKGLKEGEEIALIPEDVEKVQKK